MQSIDFAPFNVWFQGNKKCIRESGRRGATRRLDPPRECIFQGFIFNSFLGYKIIVLQRFSSHSYRHPLLGQLAQKFRMRLALILTTQSLQEFLKKKTKKTRICMVQYQTWCSARILLHIEHKFDLHGGDLATSAQRTENGRVAQVEQQLKVEFLQKFVSQLRFVTLGGEGLVGFPPQRHKSVYSADLLYILFTYRSFIRNDTGSQRSRSYRHVPDSTPNPKLPQLY